MTKKQIIYWILVLIFLIIVFYIQTKFTNFDILSRSGALLVAASIVGLARNDQIIGGNFLNFDSKLIPVLGQCPTEEEKIIRDRVEGAHKAAVYVYPWVGVLGTLIWAFGDLVQ